MNSARPSGARRTATLDTVARDEHAPTNGAHDGTPPSTQNGARNGTQNGAHNGAAALKTMAYAEDIHNDTMDVDVASHGTAPGNDAHGRKNPAGTPPSPTTSTNGHAANEQPASGSSANGHAANGHAGNGHAANGRAGRGQTTNGRAADQQADTRQASNGHATTGRSGITQAANGHDGTDRNGDRPAANGHASAGRNGERQARNGHAVNGKFDRRHAANKHVATKGHEGDVPDGGGDRMSTEGNGLVGDPINVAGEQDDLESASVGIPGHGFTGAGGRGGESVTFGFGETAGVLPGDQRTFDDVEAGIVALWRRFGERREQPLRDRLVLHYAPLVKYVAGRVGTGLPAHVEVADLIQSGIFGLVDAIEKFEPERGLKFETYAMQRIRGAILDDLRAQDWVPRSVRGRAREVERALERLGAQLRRTPTDAELADALGLSLHELRDIYAQLQLTSVVALDELAAAGRGPTPLADILEDQEALDPVALLVDQDNRRQLAQAIAHLAERDRVVVTLYYFENLTLAEIGRVLGVTESRVCQLHTRAVLRLRAKLLEKTDA